MRRGGTKVGKNTGEKTNREAKRGEFLKPGRGQLPHFFFFFFPLLDSALLIFKMIWPSEFPVPPALSVKCLPFMENIETSHIQRFSRAARGRVFFNLLLRLKHKDLLLECRSTWRTVNLCCVVSTVVGDNVRVS